MSEKKKHRKTYLELAGLLAVAAVMLAVLFLWRQEPSGEKDQVLKIGVLLYKQEDTFISAIRSNLESVVKEYELESGEQIRMEFSAAEESQSLQNEQIDKYISLGYDVLCVNLVDRTEAAVVIDKATSAGIPIVFFNREPVSEDLQRWDKIYYVGADAKEGAEIEGQIVADYYQAHPERLDLNGDGILQYIMLEGENRHQDSMIRTEVAVQTLRDAGIQVEKLDSGVANWVRSQAAALTEQWFKQYGGQIELIICNNDDMALGAIDAIEHMGLDFNNIVGIDGTPAGLQAVADGKMLGTAVANEAAHAETIFNMAKALAKGEDVYAVADILPDKSVRIPLTYCMREDSEP